MVLSPSRSFGLFHVFGVSRRCPLLVVWFVTSVVRFLGLVRHGVVRFLAVLVCHPVVRFWGLGFVRVRVRFCHGPFLGVLVGAACESMESQANQGRVNCFVVFPQLAKMFRCFIGSEGSGS